MRGVTTKTADGVARRAMMHAQSGGIEQAINICCEALVKNPDCIDIILLLHRLLAQKGDFSAALELLLHCEYLGHPINAPIASLILAKMHCCDWDDISGLLEKFLHDAGDGATQVVDPAFLLALRDDPLLHQSIGRSNAKLIATAHRHAISRFSRQKAKVMQKGVKSKIRIGYLSGDFCDHPMSWLMENVIREHDRSKVTVIAFDYSVDDKSDIRHRILCGFDKVVKLNDFGALSNAQQIARENIDIVIDLKGYTQNTRSEILSYRPADIQVGYLGYSGTLGADWIDYVIADETVLPQNQQCYWDETFAYMSRCYFPNSENRPNISNKRNTDDFTQGIVLGFLGNTYKITREVFDLWLDALGKIPACKLVLFEANGHVRRRIELHCKVRGFDFGRIKFVPLCARDVHLSRLKHLDLVLDTFPYGGHTTAADAIWAGVPVLTCPGQSLASRVAASMMSEFGVTEMIAKNMIDYRDKIVFFSRNRGALFRIHKKLVDGVAQSRLFSSKSIAAELDRLYMRMVSGGQTIRK